MKGPHHHLLASVIVNILFIVCLVSAVVHAKTQFRGIDSKNICQTYAYDFDSLGCNWCPKGNAFSTSFSQLFTSSPYDKKKNNVNYSCDESSGECRALVGVKAFVASNSLHVIMAFVDGKLVRVSYKNSYKEVVVQLKGEQGLNITHFDGLNQRSDVDELSDDIYAIFNTANTLSVYVNFAKSFEVTNFVKSGNDILQFKLDRNLKNFKSYVITLQKSVKNPKQFQLIFTSTIFGGDEYIWTLNSSENVKFEVSNQMTDIHNDAPLRIDQELYLKKGISSSRMLITLYTSHQIRIFEFMDNNINIDFEIVDSLNTFYKNESESITVANLILETIRKPRYLNSETVKLEFPPSQNVFIAIGFKDLNELLIHSVEEFSEFNQSTSQLSNTASRIGNFPCHPNQFYRNGNCLNGMEKKIDISGPAEKISIRFSDPGQSNSLKSTPYYDNNGYLIYLGINEKELFTKFELTYSYEQFFNQYWQESIFVINNGSNIDIISLAFKQNNQSSGDCNLKLVNKLKFPSPIVYLDHSENNQHLLATTSRSKLDISSYDRYLTVCQKLEKDPDNIFLKSFSDVCKANPPTQFDESKFIFYANTCFPGTHCQNVKKRGISTIIRDGLYARGFLLTACPEGSFCKAGLKVPCPSGMTCSFGSIPRPCSEQYRFTEGGYTCFKEGLSVVESCPTSAICQTTQTEPILAPPSHYVNLINIWDGKRELKVCNAGDYCNLGRVQYQQDKRREYGNIKCPSDTYCPNPSIIEPFTCSFTNKSMDYCPVGTVENRPCPAGNYCETPHNISQCDAQQFCPNGSMSYELCPKGYYCPNPSEKIICPSGYYCTPGSIVPRSCSWFLSNCPEGSSIDTMTAGGIVLFFLFIVLLFSSGIVYKFIHALYLKSQKNKPYHSGYLLKKVKKSDSQKDSHLATRSFVNNDFTVDIGFKDLGLILRGSGKKVLDGVTGEIKHGQLTAVMGLSGCGKSTFITTLANRAYYGTSIGKILVNGKEEPLSKYNRRIGFVPQEDIMLTTMTVEETLYFSARTRLDRRRTQAEIESIVNDVLQVLRLEDIRHSIIGDQENRGISGGQRKRVNVGMELVASPVVLLLDEPTSGLDSASSKEVCEVLQTIASTGINVITVIHQPRFEIFKMFDNLLLLGKGGRTIYLGPVNRVEEYFSKEFKCEKPEGINFADYLMDISAGLDESVDPKELPSYWEEKKGNYDGSASKRGNSVSILDGNQNSYQTTIYSNSKMGGRNLIYQDPQLNHVTQFLMCLKRSTIQQLRSLQSIALDFGLVFICASFLSLLFHNKVYIGPLPKNVYSKCPGELSDVCKQPIDDPVASYAGLMSLAMALMGSMASLRVFGKEYLVFYRESQSGLGTFAYFWAKDISSLFVNLLAPFVFLTIFYTTVAPTASVLEYYYALFLNYWVSFGLGYLVSILVNPSNAQLTTVVLVFVINIFSGMTTPLPTLRDMYFPISIFPDLSYLKYSHETIYLNEIHSYKNLYDLKTSLKNMGYDWNNLTTNPIVLLAFGFGFRILAFISLVCVKPSSLFKLVYFFIYNFILNKFRMMAKGLSQWREERRLAKLTGNTLPESSINDQSDSISLVTN